MRADCNRRRLLKTCGIIGATFVSGCKSNNPNGQAANTTDTLSKGNTQSTEIGSPQSGDGQSKQVPEYTDYLIPVKDQMIVMRTVVDAFYDLLPQEGLEGIDDDARLINDPPMVKFPVGISFSLLFFTNVALSPAGLNTDQGRIQEDSLQTNIEEVIGSGFASGYRILVAKGSIDTDEIDQALRSAPEDESFNVEMTRVDGIDGYVLYQQADSPTDDQKGMETEYDSTIAVGENEIIVASEEHISRVIQKKQDDQVTGVERYDPLEWALATAGDGHMVFGGYSLGDVAFMEALGGEEEFYRPEVLFEADGFIISNRVDDDEIAAEMGVVFDSLSDRRRNQMKQRFGRRASNYSMTFDSNRVSAVGTYDRDIIVRD